MDLLENEVITGQKASGNLSIGGVTSKDVGNFVSGKVNDVQNFFKAGTSNFDIASIPTKVGEGAKKLLGSFGSLSPFKNLSNGLPTGDLAKQLAQQGIGIGAGQTLSGGENLAAPRENLDDIVIVLESTISSDYVRFDVSPRVSESRQANYHEINITHHPGTILKYEKTSSRSWTISARFVSRTQEEATINQEDLNIIRSWVMPFYGGGTEKNDPSMLGAPPPVLKLSGYGAKNISPIPVVLESYSTSWPNDIDYLPTNTGDPFPVIMEIELTLKESYSPAEYSKFNLFAYKTGDLSEAFSGAKFEAKTSAGAANEKSDTSEPSVLGGGTASIIGKSPAAALSGIQSQAQGMVSSAQGFANQATGMLTKVEAEVKAKIGTSITSGISLVKDTLK